MMVLFAVVPYQQFPAWHALSDSNQTANIQVACANCSRADKTPNAGHFPAVVGSQI
jgi:hypothetical protein